MAAENVTATTGKWLVIETSSSVGTVALVCGGDVVQRVIEEPRTQTARLMPLIDELLRQGGLAVGDLDAMVVGRGPGSFTGLRVAAAVAQGLALASAVPIVSVSSLAALAERARRETGAKSVLTCVDARMGEVYWAHYLAGESPLAPMQLQGAEQLGRADSVVAPENPWLGAGSGFALEEPPLMRLRALATDVDAALYPEARDLMPQARVDFSAGQVLTPEAALPVYLRSASAWHKSA